ncbi:hypothetical protein B0H14DRAFT_2621733 [Mycena olivaceomarginata]|nr:hypothetical protein B0H14DRAFT_2621733 [Mycena olivaceomarginata]
MAMRRLEEEDPARIRPHEQDEEDGPSDHVAEFPRVPSRRAHRPVVQDSDSDSNDAHSETFVDVHPVKQEASDPSHLTGMGMMVLSVDNLPASGETSEAPFSAPVLPSPPVTTHAIETNSTVVVSPTTRRNVCVRTELMLKFQSSRAELRLEGSKRERFSQINRSPGESGPVSMGRFWMV